MKNLTAIILMFVFFACQQPDKQRQIKPPVNLVTDDLNYFVYAWYYPNGQWEFYLDSYLNIDKMGHFKLMLRDSLQKPKYFTGVINDTITKLVDQTFSGERLKTDYKSDSIQNIAYDGYTYCFYYKTEKAKQYQKLQFIQSRNPGLIRTLSIQLDNLVFNSKATQVDTLDLTASINEFKKISAASLGEPPKLDKTKFKPISIRP